MTLLATVANDPDHMPSLLFSLDKELDVSRTHRGASWGVGYYADDRALTIHKPAELLIRKGVHGVAPDLHSRILLACSHTPEPPHVALDRAPPHRFRRWLFACRGDLADLEAVRGRVREKLPDFLSLELGEGSVSQLAFAIFLAELRRDSILDDSLATVPAFKAAVGRAFEHTRTLMTEARGMADPVPMAFAMSNGRVLLVGRGSEPVQHRLQEGLDSLPEGPLDPARTDFNDLAVALKRFRAVVFRAGDLNGEGWQTLPENEIAAVDLTLQWL